MVQGRNSISGLHFVICYHLGGKKSEGQEIVVLDEAKGDDNFSRLLERVFKNATEDCRNKSCIPPKYFSQRLSEMHFSFVIKYMIKS